MNYLHALLVAAITSPFVSAQSATATQQANQVPATSTLATETLIVRGRLVDDATGEPVRRGAVRLTGHAGTGYDLSWYSGDWSNPAEVTTADDGRFRFEMRIAAPQRDESSDRYHLNISHPQYCAWYSHCTIEAAVLHGGVDYGDIRLSKGVRPRIRCVDTNGKLQAGVLITASALERPSPPKPPIGFGLALWIDTYVYRSTDIDGYLHLKNPVLAGDYTLTVKGREAVGLPDKVTLSNKGVIEVVVKPLPTTRTITGRLVDGDGLPVGGARLEARNCKDRPGCNTRRDGYFTLVGSEAATARDATFSMARNRRFDNWSQLDTVAWGSRDVQLTVPALAKATFVVTDEQGQPVPAFNIYCLPLDERSKRPGVRISKPTPDGRVTCHVAPGDYTVLVTPRTDRLVRSGWQTFTIESGEHDHSIKLASSRERTIRVAFADGRPAPADTLVEIITGPEPEPFEFVRPITALVRPSRRPPSQVLVASARVTQQGVAHVWLADPGEVFVRVSGSKIQTRVVAVDVGNATKPAHIEVLPGGTVSGQLTPVVFRNELDPEFDPKRNRSIYGYRGGTPPTISLVFAGGQRDSIPIDARGHFTCHGVPPGPVEVLLEYKFWVDRTTLRLADPYSLGKFTLTANEPLKVEIEVPEELRKKGNRRPPK